MSIKNISFITPISDYQNFKLEKEYSQNVILTKDSSINLSSHNGIKEKQQDSLFYVINNNYIILGVADGMGGIEQGEKASYQTLQTIKEYFEMQSKYMLNHLNEYILEEMIYGLVKYLKNNNFPDNAGTTLSLSFIGPEQTIILNIGDSRAYTIKGNEISLRTHDDSLSFELFEPLTKKERDKLRFYKNNNVITNYIKNDFLPYVNITTINNDEYDIICHVTDGITDILNEDTIKQCLLSKKPASSLVGKAIKSELEYNQDITEGFTEFIYPHDNATAIVYKKKKRLFHKG